MTPSTTLTGRIGAPLDSWTRYASPQAPLPVYFPDEALLIKAEALANQNQLAPAQAALDSVRTDCTGGRGLDDPKACLPALGGQLTQDQLLDRDLRSAEVRAVRHRASLGGCASPERDSSDRRRRPPSRRTASAAGCRTRSVTATPIPTRRSPRFRIRRSRRRSQRAAHSEARHMIVSTWSRRAGVGALAFGIVAAACGTKDAPVRCSRRGPTGRIRFVNLITDPARNPVNAILEGVPFGVNLTYTAEDAGDAAVAVDGELSRRSLRGARTLVLKKTADTTVDGGDVERDRRGRNRLHAVRDGRQLAGRR